MTETVPEQVNLKVLINAELKEEFDRLLEQKKIKLTAAIDSLARFVLSQDSLLQSIILGQIQDADQLAVAELVVSRLRRRAGHRRASGDMREHDDIG